MAEPALVSDCVKAMVDVVGVPITVKHRIGIDKNENYGFVRDFVGQVSEAGCSVFIVHARNAWLKGLSPKENRDIPPLRYATVHQLKQEFPQLTIVINGGLTDNDALREQLAHVDGAMLGRVAYHNPWWLSEWDAAFFDEPPSSATREQVEDSMVDYMERQAQTNGDSWYSIARHMLGLRHGMPGARKWRQVWSDHRLKSESPRAVMAKARQMGAVA